MSMGQMTGALGDPGAMENFVSRQTPRLLRPVCSLFVTPPNWITIARMVAVPFVLWLILADFDGHQSWAALAYAIAATTDSVDGFLARRQNWVSVTGAFLDPLADKLLVSGALIALVERRELSTWIAFAIVAREFAVTGLRLVAVTGSEVISASWLGKLKTLVQNVMIVALLIVDGSRWWLTALIALAVALTLWSFADYVWGARRHFTNRPA